MKYNTVIITAMFHKGDNFFKCTCSTKNTTDKLHTR